MGAVQFHPQFAGCAGQFGLAFRPAVAAADIENRGQGCDQNQPDKHARAKHARVVVKNGHGQ